MTCNEIDRRTNAIVAPLSSKLGLLIQSAEEINAMSSIYSTEGNVMSARWRLSGQHSNQVIRVPTNPFSKGNPPLRYKTRSFADNTPCRRVHQTAEKGVSGGKTDDQVDHFMVAITDLPRRLHTSQARTEVLQTQVPVFQGQKRSEMSSNNRFSTTSDRSKKNSRRQEIVKVAFLPQLFYGRRHWNMANTENRPRYRSQIQKSVCPWGLQSSFSLHMGSTKVWRPNREAWRYLE